MADAKITLETVVKSDELKQLNTTIAETNTKYKEAQAAVKDFEKACGGVANMTSEQKAQYNSLNTAMNQYRDVLRAASTEKNKEIRDLTNGAKAANDNSAAIENLKNALSKISPAAGSALGSLTSFGPKLQNIQTNLKNMATANGGGMSGLFTGIVSSAPKAAAGIAGIGVAIAGVVTGLAKMGAGAQQTLTRLTAFTGSVNTAKQLAAQIKIVTQQTQFSRTAVTQMMTQLVKMGQTATQAAKTVKSVSDAAYGLGKGEEFAQQIVSTMARITMTGKVTARQIMELQAAGLDVDKAFESMGMTADEVAQGIQNGSVNSADAIQALTDYMGQFDGATETATDNFTDNFNRMETSASGVLSAIGQYFADAFNQSDLLNALMDLFNDLTAAIKGPLAGAFQALGSVATFVLNAIAVLIRAIDTVINVVAAAIRAAGNAFDSACAEMRNALGPVYDFLMDIVSAIGMVLRGLAAIAAKINSNAKAYAASGGMEDSSLDVTMATGHSMDAYQGADESVDMSWAAPTGGGGGGGGGGRSGGGGGGGSSGPSAEELAKKQHEEELKALREANKLAEERLSIEDKLTTIKADLQATAQKTLISLQKQFGTDTEKYNAEMKAAQIDYNQSVLKETLRYREEELQLADKLKEAILDGKDNEADIIRKKQALAKQQNAATLSDLQSGYEGKTAGIQYKEIDRLAQLNNETRIQQRLYVLEQQRRKVVEDIRIKGVQTGKTNAQIAVDVAAVNKLYAEQKQQLENIQTRQDSIHDAMNQAVDDFASGISKAIVEGQNLGDVFKQVLQTLIEAVIQAEILAALHAIGLKDGGSVGKALGGLIESHANGLAVGGGEVFGPGTRTSDSILTRLSRGEYVLKADAVDRIGIPALDAMNAGALPKFADGGVVGIAGGGKSTNVVLNISTLDASSFKSFLRKGGLNNIKQALLDSNRAFATEKGVW